MLTAVYALGRIVGAELMLAGWSVCAIVYLACGLYRRRGQGRRGRKLLLLGLLAAEALVDLFCALVFFPGGEYCNWGVGGAAVVLLWPLALAAAYALTALFYKCPQ